MVVFRGIGFKIFVAVMAVIALVVGVNMTFFRTRGLSQTTATVSSVEVEDGVDDEKEYTVMVDYTVEGNTYTALLDAANLDKYQEGQTVEVYYDPAKPEVVKTKDLGVSLYVLIVGIVLLAWVIFDTVKTRHGVKELKETTPSFGTYMPSVKGEERELYFLSDRGTAKVGHHIEDKDRKVLYEGKVTKFTLTTPTGFDFIDHVNAKTTPHLVGHEESAEYNSLLLDNYYTFTFDGENIWDHLKRNGITVKASKMDGNILWVQYRIYRDGEEIALAKSSSMYVHEEDEAGHGKLSKLVPMTGYYRVWTREQNLDLIFLTLMAFARTGARNDEGGSNAVNMLLGRGEEE